MAISDSTKEEFANLRNELALVESRWQLFLQKRFAIASMFAAAMTALIGTYLSATSKIVDRIGEPGPFQLFLDDLMPMLPVLGIMLVVVYWSIDYILEQGQNVVQDRGIDVENILNARGGIFSRMHAKWSGMPSVTLMHQVVTLRGAIAMLLIVSCSVVWVQTKSAPQETTIEKIPTKSKGK